MKLSQIYVKGLVLILQPCSVDVNIENECRSFLFVVLMIGIR